MSAAPVIPTETPEQKDARQRERMSQLWRWLLSLGVCDCCASTFAIAQVEKEDGKKWNPWPRTCEQRNRRGQTCREAATTHWKAMPKVGEP